VSLARNSRLPRLSAPEILITWPDYDDAADELGGALATAGLRVRLEPKLGARKPDEMMALVGDAAGAIVSTDPFDRQVLAAAKALRVIARVGVGVDSIDLAGATALGIAVTATPGANDGTVADHAVALMLAALRRIGEHDAGVRRGEWNRTGAHTPWSLTNSTVGLVGFGRTGRLVAERLRGFNVRLIATDPLVPRDSAAEMVELATLLRASDIVSLHLPLTPQTQGLIGAAELELMKPDAILVNTARGGVVDEGALAAALAGGRLRAAALDVFADEPPAGSPLLTLPNVTLSPHVAGLSVQSVAEMTRRATASVIDVLAGRMPEYLANPAVTHSEAFVRGRELTAGDGG
jgi:D-3-phosphoglycerate dehydrogenase